MTRNLTMVFAVAALSAALPADAEILELTFRGTVGQLDGDATLLGSPAANAAYRLVYRADFSKGRRGGGGGGFAGGNFILGGTSQSPDKDYPRVELSPVSAILVVGDRSVVFDGTVFGELSYIYDTSNVQFGGSGSSRAEISANDQPHSMIATSLESARFQDFNRSVQQPFSLIIDGTSIRGETVFSLAAGGGTVSGRLTPVSFNAVVVPEPTTWAMLVAGFGLVGAGLRRRRRCNVSPA